MSTSSSSNGVLLAGSVAYALPIGFRYLRSKKRATVSLISVVAVLGVTFGVAALLAVMSITTGFQDEFEKKLLGVNGHVIVRKYGIDFKEYPRVISVAESSSEVVAAAPFVIHEMMLSAGTKDGAVLVKGIDPERTPRVLDLPTQMVRGSLEGLRPKGSLPITDDSDEDGTDGPLDRYLKHLGDASQAIAPATSVDAGHATAVNPPVVDAGAIPVDAGAAVLTQYVPTPEQMEQALVGLEEDAEIELPSDEDQDALFDDADTATAVPPVPGQLPGLVVGATLAESLHIKLGDVVTLISPLAGFDASAWGVKDDRSAPKSAHFVVTGVFQAGFQEYDTRLVYADYREVQRFVNQGDTVTGVELKLTDHRRAPEYARKLEADLGGTPLYTTDWHALNENLFLALMIQKIMLNLVIATIIFVAAFNVVATLIMVVIEKKRDIAILKAMGAPDSTILGVFFVQGLFVGTVGTFLGLLLGGGACAYLATFRFPLDPKVYLIDHLPVRTSMTEVLVTAAASLLICLMATLLPSAWAARMVPADGVRGE